MIVHRSVLILCFVSLCKLPKKECLEHWVEILKRSCPWWIVCRQISNGENEWNDRAAAAIVFFERRFGYLFDILSHGCQFGYLLIRKIEMQFVLLKLQYYT